MNAPYDGHTNTALFLKHSSGCTSVLDLFEKVKKIDDTILQGNIVEGLVKVLFASKPWLGMKSVEYADKNAEGIDLICHHKKLGVIPVQVKFRSSEALSNDDLNSFGKVNWLSGHKLGYVVGNLRDVPADWHNDKVMLFIKEDFRDIDLQDLINFASVERTENLSHPMVPRGFQEAWIEQMRPRVNKMVRGKILGPPGLGKTLGISTYIRLLKKNKLGAVMAPWKRLVNQNLIGVVDELTAHGYNVNYIVVNSDSTIKGPAKEEGELNEYNIVQPTTDVKEIKAFIKEGKKDKTSKNLYIIFGCYGSTEVIMKAAKGTTLNYGLFDEGHHLAGHISKRNPQLLFNKNIKFARRVFVTATERTYDGDNDEIVAMNSDKLFGGILCFCSFKDAIEHGNIKDYRVVFPNLSGKEVNDWWSRLKENLYVQDNGEPVTMTQVILKVMIYAMYRDYPITRMIAGFNRIANAQNMSAFLQVEDSITKHYGFVVKSTWVSSFERQATNNKRLAEFADSQERYVMCAPPMLKEGVDIKGLDKNGKAQYPNAVVFCDNKRGEIGIVQLAGRGFRMGQDKKELCYIGLPIVYHPEEGQKEVFNEAFERAKEVIVSLGCSDERIAQELTTIRAGKTGPKLYKTSTKIIEVPEVVAENVKFRGLVKSLTLSCVRSLQYTTEKASYLKHVKECKKYPNANDYIKAEKDPKFYHSHAKIIKRWPEKDLFEDVGWNHYDEKTSYKEHVKECKKYKSGRAYNEAKKNFKFHCVIAQIQKKWPNKDLFKDVGWFNVKAKKASYEEHVRECKKYKSGSAYNRAKKNPKFYYGIAKLQGAYPDKDLYKDVGWFNQATNEKASYKEHVKECKKYRDGQSYNKAKKDKKFYSVTDKIQRIWKDKDLYKDVGWFDKNMKKASYEEHVKECKKYKSGGEYHRADKEQKFYYHPIEIRRRWPNKDLYKDVGWKTNPHFNR